MCRASLERRQPLPLRRSRPRRGLHRPRGRRCRSSAPTCSTARTWSSSPRAATASPRSPGGGAGAGAAQGARRPGGPDDHADEGEARREARRRRSTRTSRRRCSGRASGSRCSAGLRVAPTITIDPEDGSVGFSFEAGRAAGGRGRDARAPASAAGAARRPSASARVVLILDEFQEVVEIDPDLPKLMRSVFQEQPDVAHVYLGSKRHMMERIFNDENEPFWRSAKQMELGRDRAGALPAPHRAALRDRTAASRGRRGGRRPRGHGRAPLRDPGALLRALGADARGPQGHPRPLRGGAGRRAALRARPLQPRLGQGHLAPAPRARGAGTRARPAARVGVPPPPRPPGTVERPARAAEPRAGRSWWRGKAPRTASPSRSWRSGSSATRSSPGGYAAPRHARAGRRRSLPIRQGPPAGP